MTQKPLSQKNKRKGNREVRGEGEASWGQGSLRLGLAGACWGRTCWGQDLLGPEPGHAGVGARGPGHTVAGPEKQKLCAEG